MQRYGIVLAIALFLVLGPTAGAETVRIEAARDATMIEDPDGARANGAGPLFAGRTSEMQNGVRRALLYFDVAAAVPDDALIESATVTLHVIPSNPEPREYRLHRVLADWSEGSAISGGGMGAPSGPGDVTWLHTSYDQEFWVHSGGQFVGRASAGLDVAASGFYTWSRTNQLVRDVRLWSKVPQRNFGWVLIGDETTRQTAKIFSSREAADASVRPVLEITYRRTGMAPLLSSE